MSKYYDAICMYMAHGSNTVDSKEDYHTVDKLKCLLMISLAMQVTPSSY